MGKAPSERKAGSAPSQARAPKPASANRLREMLLGSVAQILVAPLIGIIAGFLLLFGGIFLAVAWSVGPQPLIDSRHYAMFTGKVTGHIVESWTALEFDPADMGQKKRWFGFGKIAPCAIVEYAGDWGAPLHRAFCGNRFNFSDDFHLHDWNTLAPGIPFAFQRDASGFMLQEIRMSKTARDWLAANPPYSTFMLSTPPPITALGALKEQFDRPVDVAVASWSAAMPTLPLVYDPQHPDQPMPAKYVDDRRQFWLGGLVFAAILAVPGLLVWRLGMGFFFGGQPAAVLWLLTLAPLLALPWWADALPQLLRRANQDWAGIATDMLDDISRTTRLIASAPADASLAGGERVIWHLDAGAYADTFGRVHFAMPEPAPKSSELALAALRTQVSAQVQNFDAGEQVALFVQLRQDKDAGLDKAVAVFTKAAEDVVLDVSADPAARTAARNFLLFGMQYNEWDVDALEKKQPAHP